MGVDRARRNVPVDLPHVTEESGPGLHSVATVAERHEKAELERLLVDPGAMGVAVDPERSEAEHRGRRPLGGLAPENRLHPEEELADAERFDDVVVRAKLEADDAVNLLPLRRHHHDRNVLRRLVALERLADLEPRDVREHEIEKENVGRVGPGELEPLEAGLGNTYVMARLGEVVTKDLAKVELVIDHQDTRHGKKPVVGRCDGFVTFRCLVAEETAGAALTERLRTGAASPAIRSPRRDFARIARPLHGVATFEAEPERAMRGGRLGHPVLAGAVGGSAIACGVATGPILATVFDLAAAAAIAGIAAHAVETSARERGVSSAGILHRTARVAVKRVDAPLAAYAVDVACRARKGDARALRAAASMLGRAATGRLRGIALQLFASGCAPLRDVAKLGAPFEMARAALENAAFVQAMTSAVPDAPLAGAPAAAWCARGFVPLEWPFVGTLGDESERNDDTCRAGESPSPDASTDARAHVPAETVDWEVAA
jgi:hypothetical protein